MENGFPQTVENPDTKEVTVYMTPLNKEQAYDMARKEFYTIRQQEQITKRIAIEEARMVGGYFGKNRLEVGMELEDRMYDIWKNWAEKQLTKAEAERGSAYQSFGNEANVEAAEIAELGLEAEASGSPAVAPRT